MSKAVTTALTEAQDEAVTPPRQPPVIAVDWCELQAEGYRWRTWEIRLPSAAAVSDLNEAPGLWKLLQGSTKALRRFDRVVILPYNEEWLIEAIVAGATGTGVVLAGIRKVDLPARRERLAEDDLYRVEWAGRGYLLVRKSDRLRVSPVVATAAEAERMLSAKYTRNE
jgi:hypothetical protein